MVNARLLLQEYRVRYVGAQEYRNSPVTDALAVKMDDVLRLRDKFNNEGLRAGCAKKVFMGQVSKPSIKYIEPIAKLWQRFDFMCRDAKIVVPEAAVDDLYVELAHEFYTAIKNLEVEEHSDRTRCNKGGEKSPLLQYVASVLRTGDKYTTGEQKYSSATLRGMMRSRSRDYEVFLEGEAIVPNGVNDLGPRPTGC